MIVKRIFDSEQQSLCIPEQMGIPKPHHFMSTNGDNLIEVAGRICYDSIKAEKSRDSFNYHSHINEVNHGSVQEHFNFTIEFPSDYGPDLASILVNVPGIYLRKNSIDNSGYRLTINIRTAIEIEKYAHANSSHEDKFDVYSNIKYWAKYLCPMACSNISQIHPENVKSDLVNPNHPEEVWVSYYIGNISRSCSHELVRHKWRTAVSQRSTRYVDESKSKFAWHPLINEYGHLLPQLKTIHDMENQQKLLYDELVTSLEEILIKKEIDKFTARKQSRGAARGILGNALSTELIFSASLAQWGRIISQRASSHADAEIRIMANLIYDDLIIDWGDYIMKGHRVCPDGIGKELY